MMLDVLSRLPIFVLHVTPGSGAIEGFLHPILGFDHLLAMVTVGLLSAQLGGRAIWTVPLTFVVTMAVGAGIGMLGVQIPLVEYGIAASVIVLGLALLLKANLPELLAMLFVALFAVFHGWAHGAELPEMDSIIITIAYVVGFLVSTAGLHVVGALIGYILLRNQRGALLLRSVGLLIAVAGVFIMSGLFTGA
ncbi:MAG: HupE/UreJ family protein [Anaerolineae bacterium]|nr:HupE/UreJ family protein [Anaerolineae bacterium]